MHHLYRHFDGAGALLYVGVSFSALIRLGRHKTHSRWFAQIRNVTIADFPSREEALAAERKAIVEENPIHNLAGRPANREREESAADESREYLTHRIVEFSAMYTPQEAAQVLTVGTRAVRDLIENGELGSVMLPPSRQGLSPHGKPYQRRLAITGWQLIEYIEALEQQSKKRA